MGARLSDENAILNSVSDGITINSQGVLLYVNDTFAKMVGYRVSELLGMHVNDVTAPEYQELVLERTFSRQQGKDVVSIYETELVRKDGSRFPVEFNITRIDYKGKSSSLTIVRDITLRKETEQRFEDLLNLAPVAIMTYTITGHISTCNQATSDMTGYSNEELVGKHLTRLPFFNVETVKMSLKLLANIIKGQDIGPVDFLYTSKTGENKYARAYPRVITSSDGKREILVVIEDTTESTNLLNTIQESEERYHDLFDGLIDGFAYHKAVYDEDDKPVDYIFLEINERFTELVGLGPDVVGKNVTEVMPGIENDPADWIRVYGELAKKGDSIRFEQYAQPLDKWYSVSAYSPKRGYFATIFQDITEKKKVEQDLEEQIRLSQILIDQMPCIAMLLQPSTREVIASNQAARDVGAVPGEHCFVTFGQREDPCTFCLAGKVWEGLGEQHTVVEALGVVWDAYWVPISDDLYMHYAFDITEKHRREGELVYQANILQNISDGIVSTDLDYNILSWNKGAEQIYGYVESEVKGKNFADLIKIQFNGVSRAEVINSLLENESWEGEVVQFDKNGREVFVYTSVSLMKNEMGAPIGVVAVNRDITEQKLAEDSLRASEDLFRGFMQSATEQYTILDEDMRFIEVNDSWLQNAGFEREDVIGKHILKVLPGLKETGRYDVYLKVLETGEPVEYRAIETVAERRGIIDVTAFKVGTVLGLVARDVSEQVHYQKRLETLHGHAAALSSAETLDEVADITRDSLNEVIGYYLGGLGIVEGDYLDQRYIWDADGTKPFSLALDGPGVTVEVVNSGVTQNIGDVRGVPFFFNGSDDHVTVSELAVPVKATGKVVAVINIESRDVDAFSNEDQRLVETLASHVASAYAKIKYSERLSVIYGFNNELGSSESIDGVVQATIRIMGEVFDSHLTTFQLLEGDALVTVGSSDDSQLWYVMSLSGKGVTVKAANEQKSVLIGDASTDPDFYRYTYDTCSELAVPILVEDRVLGVLNIESLELDAFTEDDLRLMEMLAQNVASALFRVNAVERERSLARFPEENSSPVSRVDIDGVILYSNKAAEQLAGWDKIAGDTVSDTWLSLVSSALSSGSLSEYESVYGDRFISFNLVPMVDSGYVNIYGRDVTEKKVFDDQLSALHQHALELSKSESIEKVGATTLEIMRDVLGFEFSAILLVEDEHLRTLDTVGRTDPDILLPFSGKGITTRAVREEKTMFVPDVTLDPDYIPASVESLSEIDVPIMADGKVVGVLNVEGLEVNSFTRNDARLMEVLAANVGVAISRLRAEEEKRELERQILVEQIKVEQEQEIGQLKTRLMNTATHELRTPVTSILGYIELILADPNRDIPGDIRRDLEVVFRNANRLVTFTNDLLDVQRLTSGNIAIRRKKVDIVSIVYEMLEELSLLFDEKKQSVNLVSPKEVKVDVDELRISQLFINLLRNANKYTPEEGNITVILELSDDHVLIAVKDTGVGLSDEDIDKLFEPFPAIRHGLSVTSTGLGLAICKGIVDLHGGEIWAESDGPDKGSTFSVKLPVEP